MLFISFIFMPAYPLGSVAGAAALVGLELPHDQQQFQSSAGSTPRRDKARSDM